MPSFVEFLKTGQLEKLHCGMSKDEVRDLLGEPEAVSSQGNPQIWKYGSLELTFYRSSEAESPWLVSIDIQFHSHAIGLPGSEELNGWLPTGETTFEEFRGFLDNAAIRVDGGVTSGPHQHLVLGSGVRITFDEGRLYSASYTLRREPEFKQITVAIPRRELKAIQQQAAASGVSVSKLCSRWIMERASSLLPS
jgi:SmpA / OmlA family